MVAKSAETNYPLQISLYQQQMIEWFSIALIPSRSKSIKELMNEYKRIVYKTAFIVDCMQPQVTKILFRVYSIRWHLKIHWYFRVPTILNVALTLWMKFLQSIRVITILITLTNYLIPFMGSNVNFLAAQSFLARRKFPSCASIYNYVSMFFGDVQGRLRSHYFVRRSFVVHP